MTFKTAALGDPCHAGSCGERVRRTLAEDRQLRGELREKCEDTHGFSVRFVTQCPRKTLICVYICMYIYIYINIILGYKFDLYFTLLSLLEITGFMVHVSFQIHLDGKSWQ